MTTAPSSSAPVPVMLDLRSHSRPPASADGYIDLWNRLEPALTTVDPRSGPLVRLDLGDEGEVTVRFLAPSTVPARFGPGTPFAVRGILEPPRVRYACDTCRTAGRTAYGPFTCPGCGTGERPGRVCDDHAVFLEGSLRSFCAEHLPVCRCGRAARAWCEGPGCRTNRAWCGDHLVPHPVDTSVTYCQDCHTELFPACERRGCRGTGHTRCEHRTLHSGRACGRRMCSEHVTRWKIYGDRSRGLALCGEHGRGLRTSSPAALVALILAGTAARSQARRNHRNGARRAAFLPRITIVRHIFINTCGEVLDMGALDSLFAGLEGDLRRGGNTTGRRDHAEAALRLLQQHAPSRQEDVRRFRDSHEEGHRHFARLRALLRDSGRDDLAEAVVFSDYRSRSGILFVQVPQELRPRFIGTGGAVVKELRAKLGVNIQLER